MAIAILFAASGVRTAAAAATGLPAGRGVLLPLQDRVGEAELAELAERLLREELAVHGGLIAPDRVREVLRGQRIRDASQEPPERLAALAESLGADWFFLATLHEAKQGRQGQRPDGVDPGNPRLEDAGETPQVVLSAQVFRHDSPELWWAGFDAATGRDGETAFAVGGIESLEALLAACVRDLVGQALAREGRPPTRLRHRAPGFVRAGSRPRPPAKVAVIPMDAVVEVGSSAAAEVATAALLAALDDFGFEPLLPGLVQAIRRESGQPQNGAASRPEWEALARAAGAQWVATGTVETYRRGVGRDPDPWVALSVRFLDAAAGSIDWLDGLERSGSDAASAFDRGWIYSTGDLTYAMMQSLFAAMQSGPAATGAGSGD